MNRFTFGNPTHQYYETISGGSRAGLMKDEAGRVEVLGHVGSAGMEPGDLLVIETPGGGGCGAP